MITGLNTDVEYEGKICHVQTEDSGSANPTIVTILFHGGAILATRKTSYAARVKADGLAAIVKGMMMEQHKKMIQDLQAGRVLPASGPPLEKAGADRASTTGKSPGERPAAAPGRAKSLDDMILDYLSAREERKKS
ncbi:MAG: hypothetical protein HY204_07615 [Nitrospirae bacterium]|nr:hypothetical protein [Nitrospirota bacterium]